MLNVFELLNVTCSLIRHALELHII